MRHLINNKNLDHAATNLPLSPTFLPFLVKSYEKGVQLYNRDLESISLMDIAECNSCRPITFQIFLVIIRAHQFFAILTIQIEIPVQSFKLVLTSLVLTIQRWVCLVDSFKPGCHLRK